MSVIDDVVSVAIHPAIGVARVGNSRASFFVGPESPGRHPSESEQLRDPAGGFKRQAARFRLFGRDASGRVICEIGANDATIRWKVHLANKKAAWFAFEQALDIPASKGDLPGVRPIASPLRNRDVQGGARAGLIVDPGPRTVSASGPGGAMAFDSGTFLGSRVDLGSALMEDDGSLIVLGGFGEAASPRGEPISDFANNAGWHDDVSDGPVDATVEIAGRGHVPVLGAWVIVCPPNFAPGITPIVTGWDLVLEVMAGIHPGLSLSRPVFGEHIQPLLERVSQSQWVNSGFALQFGWGSPADLADSALLARLNDPGEAARALRQAVFAWFRNPDYSLTQADRIPAIYGDAVLIDPRTQDPREWMAILASQYGWLRRWAEGDFVPGLRPPSPALSALSPAERAAALDRAALEDTAGGPFHPGIEYTWPLRQPILYDPRNPFRIKRRSLPEPTLPAELTSSLALAPGGPLDGSTAGDITRWMAVPWQTDTASCLSGYEDYAGEYLPTFWPARVPNDVITEEGYRTIVDTHAPRDLRYAAFSVGRRRKWLRGFSYANADTPRPPSVPLSDAFVKNWPTVGLVARKPGPTNLPGMPSTLWVETDRGAGGGAGPAGALTLSPDAPETAAQRAGGPPPHPFRTRRSSRL